jgi:hypothetical protein
MGRDKTTGKNALAKYGEVRVAQASRPTEKTWTTAERAAAVEANLGGSQPLLDFLKKAGWD